MSHSMMNHLEQVSATASAGLAARRYPTLHVCGINHTRAALATRECFALPPDQVKQWLATLHRDELAEQILILSTCNRTEIYAYDHRPSCAARLRAAFLSLGGVDEANQPSLYEYQGMEAVRHLFAVGAGLDSMILGENQIKQQIQQAYELCQETGACGTQMHRLIEGSHRTSKRIRTETELNVGTLCVAKAAVLKGEQTLGGLTGKVCLIIGAGKIGGIAARAIAERRPARLWIVNRSLEKAQEIAGELGGEAYGLESLGCLLPEAEFILGAAYAPELILDAEMYRRQTEGRRPGQVCMVDAALPRILDPALGAGEGVHLFDIEHMEEIVEENRRRRGKSAEQAWVIVEEEVERFRMMLHIGMLAPVIQDLRESLERIFEEETSELEEFCSEELAARIRGSNHKIKQRLLHEIINELKIRMGVI